MTRTFDDREFQRLSGDAHHLVEQAIELEHRLVSLVNLVERQIRPTPGARPRSPTDNRRAADADRQRLADPLPQIRQVCVAAREHRHFAERYLESIINPRMIAPSANEARGRILVVEDHEDTREMLTLALRGAGLEAIAATNGLEGLVAAHYVRPSVIIMDMDMPILDGIQATRLLKAAAATRDAPVIAHTAKPEFFQGPMSRLFARVLPKPAAPGEVVGSVEEFLKDGLP
jgi:CheY-like chemotaxis protein